MDGGPTLVFKEVAHACPASKDELSDILDDLGLVFGRERDEPFSQTLYDMSVCLLDAMVCVITDNFALAGEKDEVSVEPVSVRVHIDSTVTNLMAMVKNFVQSAVIGGVLSKCAVKMNCQCGAWVKRSPQQRKPSRTHAVMPPSCKFIHPTSTCCGLDHCTTE